MSNEARDFNLGEEVERATRQFMQTYMHELNLQRDEHRQDSHMDCHEVLRLIKQQQTANENLVHWEREKAQIDDAIIKYFNHQAVDKQRSTNTYYFDKYAVKLTVGWNYKLDKAKYELFKDYIPEGFDPVEKKRVTETKYKIDHDKILALEAKLRFATEEQREVILSFLSKSPAKPNVVIGVGTNKKGALATGADMDGIDSPLF